MDGPTASDRGLLRPHEAARHIDLRRHRAAGPAAAYVERFWSVAWDLPAGAVYESVVVGHPCVNLSFMPVIGAEVHGPVLAVSRHRLTGAGRVFGAKFRPGGFTALTGVPAAALADWSCAAAHVFGPAADLLHAAVMDGDDDRAVRAVSAFVAERAPRRRDRRYERLLAIVAAMLADRTITRVDQVAERFAMSPKGVQRLFAAYVGYGAKTLIRRYRLHDAADRLASDPDADLAALAFGLGWTDQSHFTRDFKALTGSPPAAYALECASTRRAPVTRPR